MCVVNSRDRRLRTTQKNSARLRLGHRGELLARVYGRLTEGFDTRDLNEAKTLLDILVLEAEKRSS
jgi:predicted ATPase